MSTADYLSNFWFFEQISINLKQFLSTYSKQTKNNLFSSASIFFITDNKIRRLELGQLDF